MEKFVHDIFVSKSSRQQSWSGMRVNFVARYERLNTQKSLASRHLMALARNSSIDHNASKRNLAILRPYPGTDCCLDMLP